MDSIVYFCVLSLLFVNGVTCKGRTFDGYSVYRLVPDTKEKVQHLHSVANTLDSDPSYVQKVDFWKRPRQVNGLVDVMLSPDVKDEVLSLLTSDDLKAKQIVRDVQRLINSTKRPESETDLQYGSKSWAGQEMNFFTDYHRLDEVSQISASSHVFNYNAFVSPKDSRFHARTCQKLPKPSVRLIHRKVHRRT